MPLYVGDTDEKRAYLDPEGLGALGVTVGAHGKMPDVIIHHAAKNWLVLIEAVTSHGPVNPKRRDELKRLLKGARAGLVFVTAFLTRKRIVFTDAFADEEGNVVEPAHYGMSSDWPTETLVTVTFVEHEGKTKLTLQQSVLQSVAERSGAQQGWTETMDRLAEELAKA